MAVPEPVKVIAAPSHLRIRATVPADICPPSALSTTLSTSVTVLAVMVAAIWSPTMTVRAEVLSCIRVMVKVSVLIFVTLTISAFAVVGCTPVGQIVALNGTAGNFVPSPAVTTRDVPLVAGEGAVATSEYAKFL